MCGIVGFFEKSGTVDAPVGVTLLRMLTALGCRGPDSAGMALWGEGADGLVVRVKLGATDDLEARRRIYEQAGVRFYTENDSEIIGVYLARQLAGGRSLGEALAASVRELDGSFSYLAATADAFGFAKDPFGLKPLLVAETERAVAIANEEIALQGALGGPSRAREAGVGAVG